MDVLHVVFQHEIARLYLAKYLVESCRQRLEFFCAEKADAFQHPDVCLRAYDVISCQTHVQNAVVSYCKILYQVSRLCTFAPKCAHSSVVISSEVERSLFNVVYKFNICPDALSYFADKHIFVFLMRALRFSRSHLDGVAVDPHPIGSGWG